MFTILRDEESGICMTDGSFLSTGSQVSVLTPPSSSACPTPSCHWFTATPNPLTSIYKPFIFAPGGSIGSATVSPQFGDDDPAKKVPRFQVQVIHVFIFLFIVVLCNMTCTPTIEMVWKCWIKQNGMSSHWCFFPSQFASINDKRENVLTVYLSRLSICVNRRNSLVDSWHDEGPYIELVPIEVFLLSVP